jgi:hypothetical protein
MFNPGAVVNCDFEGFLKFLRSKTRAFLKLDGHDYYVTHTDCFWRVQDCAELNEKGHFSDCSELVNTMVELVELPWKAGKSIHDLYSDLEVREAVEQLDTAA